MIDITPDIITYCKNEPELVSLLSSSGTPDDARIQAPYFTVENGDNQDRPCVAIKTQGGGKEFHRYNFLVRGSTPQEAKHIAIIIIDMFTKRSTRLKSVDITWVNYNGNLYEYVDSIMKYPEVSFTLDFYFHKA